MGLALLSKLLLQQQIVCEVTFLRVQAHNLLDVLLGLFDLFQMSVRVDQLSDFPSFP